MSKKQLFNLLSSGGMTFEDFKQTIKTIEDEAYQLGYSDAEEVLADGEDD